jgi:hypothetical protein
MSSKANGTLLLVGNNSNPRQKNKPGSTTTARSAGGDRPQGDPGGARRVSAE